MVKRRKFFAIACAVVMLCGVVLYGTNSVYSSMAAYEWQDIAIESEYEYGTTLQIPSRKITVNGTDVTATHSLVFPDGTATDSASVVLNVCGDYKLNYYATANGKSYADTVAFSVKTIAYKISNTTLSSAAYGNYNLLGANSNGIIIRLANKDSVEFASVIDMSNSSLSESLIEGFITPDTRGVYDFDRLIFTFTDIEDSSVYLKFQMNRYQSSSVGFGTSFVLVGGNGQDMVGYEKDETGKNPHVNDGVGTPIEGVSFIAQKNAGGWSGAAQNIAPDSALFKFYYDVATSSTYAGDKKISVLNDSMYYKTFWTGFPSGKARLSISASGYSATTANFCITKVAGLTVEELAGNYYTDTEGPAITVDTTYTEMPVAEVGTKYTIPTATAYDTYTGRAIVDVSVWYDYSSNNATSVGIVNGCFTPSKQGYYTIVYSATDGFSNTTIKTLTVRAVGTAPKITVSLEIEPIKEIELGRKVTLADAITEGGSGNVTVVKSVTFGDKNIGLTNDSFTPEESGEYTITYTATDYIGKTAAYSYKLNAKAGTTPILNITDITLPKIFIADCGYTLPEVYADDYTTGTHRKVLADVKVTDKEGEKTYKAGDRIVPKVSSNGDTVKVVYYSGNTTLDAIYVPTIIAKNNKSINIPNYFHGDVTATYLDDKTNEDYSSGIAIVNENASDKAGWLFANAVAADNFSIQMSMLAGYTQFDAFVFTLTDSEDYSKAITFTISVGSTVTVTHGGESYKISKSLLSDIDLDVEYSEGVIVVTIDKTILNVTVTEYADGTAFGGFSSGKVYVELATTNNKANSRYKIRYFCENVITFRNYDNKTPDVAVSGSLPAKVSINKTFTVRKAVAADVYAPESSLTMTVYDPDDNVVTSVDGVSLSDILPDREYVVKAKKYGNYKIVYTIQEVNWINRTGRTTGTIEQYVNVPDEELPTLTFTTAGTKEASVGDVIVMPDFTLNDNVTPSDRIKVWKYVINPNGRIIELDEKSNSVKCDYSGTYTFVIYIADVELGDSADNDIINNVAIYKYTVTVK